MQIKSVKLMNDSTIFIMELKIRKLKNKGKYNQIVIHIRLKIRK